MRYSIVGIVLLLTGCASQPPAAWLLYSRASYLYGRIEALAESHCKAPVPVDRAEVCREAKGLQQEVKVINPVIQAELSKEEPDWQVIVKYLDLVLGVAGRLILP